MSTLLTMCLFDSLGQTPVVVSVLNVGLTDHSLRLENWYHDMTESLFYS